METNNNCIENGIRLQDGRIIQGYRKSDVSMEDTSRKSALDTTGAYFSIGKKPGKPRLTPDEELQLRNLFTDNAFLILANRERILNDSRMLLTPVPVHNGIAYSGEFETATLGVYLEWWMNAPYSVLFDDDGTMSLIWFVSGSPLTGGNSCSKVYEDGRREIARTHFSDIWPKFADIIADYHDAKLLYQAYSLPEVIDILKRETTTEDYVRNITAFYRQALMALYNTKLANWKVRCEEVCGQRTFYQRKWFNTLIQSRQDKVKSFYEGYVQREEALKLKEEAIKAENRRLKKMMQDRVLPFKRYRLLKNENLQELSKMSDDLTEYGRKGEEALFPELADHPEEADKALYSYTSMKSEILKYFQDAGAGSADQTASSRS